jgi:hypothetical protein
MSGALAGSALGQASTNEKSLQNLRACSAGFNNREPGRSFAGCGWGVAVEGDGAPCGAIIYEGHKPFQSLAVATSQRRSNALTGLEGAGPNLFSSIVILRRCGAKILKNGMKFKGGAKGKSPELS